VSADYVLLFGCPDRIRIREAVESWVRGVGAVPTGLMHLYRDSGDRLFGRIEFQSSSAGTDQLVDSFAGFADHYGMQWTIQPLTPPHMLVMAGDEREAHVLSHLLVEQRACLLPAEIVAVGSSSDSVRGLVESYDVPFEHIPWPTEADGDPAGQALAHATFMQLVKRTGATLVFLARFSRVLPAWICQELRGWCLNIHHGMVGSAGVLASPGANPYRQAAWYGVRGIGATVLYVNDLLDGGGVAAQEWRHIENLPPYPSTRDLKVEGRLAEIAATMTALRLYSTGRLLLFNTGDRDHVVKL
jgi:formyltetrahydrofolate deformylase